MKWEFLLMLCNPLCVAIHEPVVHLLLVETLEGRNNKVGDEFCGLE